jgi:hypothetical protein
VRQHHPADVAVRLDPVLRDVTEKLLGHSLRPLAPTATFDLR